MSKLYQDTRRIRLTISYFNIWILECQRCAEQL